jgi:hypothetical protein
VITKVHEINRVLWAIYSLCDSGPAASVSLESVIRACQSTVQGGLLFDHSATVAYGAELGLIAVNEGELSLTAAGTSFISLNPTGFYELTAEQKKVLTINHYFDGLNRRRCREALAVFNLLDEKRRLAWSELDDKAMSCPAWVIDHLCQLDVLVRQEDGYAVQDEMFLAALNFLDEPKGMTEEKLRAYLEEKSAIGEIGEELVVQYERSRLQTLGAPVEASCVRRISRSRVNAGYDIASFDGKSGTVVFDRFIEVKAAKAKTLRFFWSENEMEVARKLRDRYWIYFLGGVNATSRTASRQPLTFQDPIQSIMTNADVEKTPQGLLIEAELTGESA